MAHVLIDDSNTVVNVIVYDESKPYTPPGGLRMKSAPNGVTIGWKFDGASFTPPEAA